ncbi:PAS domain-containing protein [Flavobacterium algicola]|uniref:PAS domain-containing protein n=1 Tax=Flavobacterium algicola TaxID=556529 RepID=UPI001EFE83C7|nr:PAS domain-containing protein [Flavobacterium algicola]MCG9794079.1 PAS domain-containing protein [Flavobacterium algicola]
MTPEYDKALVKYSNSLRIVPLPLLSWDFFASHTAEINKFVAIQKHWKSKVNFSAINSNAKTQILITNSNQEIVFASPGIYKMNGYYTHEIIGKTPKIFQGELTSSVSRENIKTAIQNNLPFKEVIVNYKKDGSTYLCEIEAYPKFNKKGELVNYIAFERIAS